MSCLQALETCLGEYQEKKKTSRKYLKTLYVVGLTGARDQGSKDALHTLVSLSARSRSLFALIVGRGTAPVPTLHPTASAARVGCC